MLAVQIAQAVCASLWFLVILFSMKSVVAVMRSGVTHFIDCITMMCFANAVVQVGFVTRWYVWPASVHSMPVAETSFWIALYVASSLVSAGTLGTLIAFKGRKP